MPCNASTLLAANPFTQLDPGLQDAVKLQLLCDISSTAGGGPPVGGSGTAGKLAKFTAGTTLGNSLFSESGSTITLAQGTIAADAPALSITSTYNNAAVTFGGALKVNVTDTASASGSLLMDLQVGGASRFNVAKDGVVTCGASLIVASAGILRFSGRSDIIAQATGEFTFRNSSGGNLCRFAAEADNVWAMRSTTNAQTFNIYNTYTSSTNYERGFLSWVSNEFRIGTEKGSGGGSARDVWIYRDGAQATAWNASQLVLYPNTRLLTWVSSSRMSPDANGNLVLYNSGVNDWGLLKFGGTTSSFPALKRSSATLQCRLADDSAFANLQGKLTTDTNYTGGAPTPTGYLVVYDAAGTAYKIPAEAV